MAEKKISKSAEKKIIKAAKRRAKLVPQREDVRTRLRDDILDHITQRGYLGQHYEDLVETYMSFWDVLQNLLDDIDERGVCVRWQNSETSFGVKKNESISEAVKVSSSMSRIWQLLDLHPVDDDDKDPGDDEM